MITRGTTAMMATGVADARAREQLELSHRVLRPARPSRASAASWISPPPKWLSGTSAASSIGHHGPVIVDLTALGFCDAQGLSALVRMAGYAERAAARSGWFHPVRQWVKIMRITGLDRRFLVPPASGPPES